MSARFGALACCASAAGVLVLAGSAEASFPGTNGKIAFAHDPGTAGSNVDIFTMDSTGQNRTQLTTGPEAESQPSYSADGEKIAFARFPNPSSPGQIWVMSQDGSAQNQLTSGSPTADDSEPAFSPDGKLIGFERHAPGTEQIWIMNADGSGQTQLTFPGPAGDDSGEPSFSPDGQRIVFRRTEGTTSVAKIWVMNSDGSGQAPLTTGAGSADFDPDFSPDGQRIVFGRFNGSEDDLWIMNADGSGQSQLTSGADLDFDPVFAPDGTRIAFERENAAFTFGNIFLADPTGLNQNVTQLTSNSAPVFDFVANWQPLNPPSCDLAGKTTSKSVKRVSVTVTCANENATVVAGGSGKAPKLPKAGVAIASKAKRFQIPAVTAEVPEDSPTTLALKIPKKGKKALKKAAKAGKKGKATIIATLTDDLGQSSSDSFKVRFKAKKQ